MFVGGAMYVARRGMHANRAFGGEYQSLKLFTGRTPTNLLPCTLEDFGVTPSLNQQRPALFDRTVNCLTSMYDRVTLGQCF